MQRNNAGITACTGIGGLVGKKVTPYQGIAEKDYKPKVLIFRSIKYLPRYLLIRLFAGSELVKDIPRMGKREIEAVRDLWLAWLDKTPRHAFLGYTDAYYQFLEDAHNNLLPGSVEDRGGQDVLEAAVNALERTRLNDRQAERGNGHT